MCFSHCGFNAAKVKKKFNVVQMIICILFEGNNATRCIPKILIHAFIIVWKYELFLIHAFIMV